MNVATGILVFFIPCCAYAAQDRACKSLQELKKTNAKLDRLPMAPLRQE